jgi:glycogen(starch) synthase
MVAKYLFEVSAEVCYKVGGIHTVLESKAPYMIKAIPCSYYLIGPFLPEIDYKGIFEDVPLENINDQIMRQSLEELRKACVDFRYGQWSIEGQPNVILLNPYLTSTKLDEYRRRFLFDTGLPVVEDDAIALYINFSFLLSNLFKALSDAGANRSAPAIVHFHEYMASMALPQVKAFGFRTVFTTHSTVIGRQIASDKLSFREKIKQYDVPKEEGKFNDYHKFCSKAERLAATECDLLTTVSRLTAVECEYFLGRYPDVITTNGVNARTIEKKGARYTTYARQIIDRSINEIFSRHYNINLSKTIYFFSSGRYEYFNKGYNTLVESLSLLNKQLRGEKSEANVIMIFITDRPFANKKYYIQNKIKQVLRYPLKKLGVKFKSPPPVFMHDVHEAYTHCQLVGDLMKFGLTNKADSPVKVLYHPQFLSQTSPSLKLNYFDFIKACDLGIFPSRYEPWGYTPVECFCVGTPSVTTSSTGVGDFLLESTNGSPMEGLYVLKTVGLEDDAKLLSRILKNHIQKRQTSEVEFSTHPNLFDWTFHLKNYLKAYAQLEEAC